MIYGGRALGERRTWCMKFGVYVWPFRHVIVLFVDVRASMNWAELNFELLYIEFVMIQKCNNSSVLNDTNNGPSNASTQLTAPISIDALINARDPWRTSSRRIIQ